ncbi:glycoside hydrolase family 53 protein [Streptomyces millisiae]|uniref:Arabinogalactan endo-beta-1,4-galactanase n=1 Tax=Streptomyces millisiae TaxID=3075542 RepID=A0ABU2M173_9ACTN|nr:arabinogalactan endo-1,4-beta-galactosidase [Streptomyces sp. DSM 44918]MDT0323595.1 arabinogalactan endo-1,4-beta-galactosidase [Streptomyces sp. DSM 44918]
MMRRRTILRAGTAAIAAPVASVALTTGAAQAAPVRIQGVDLSSVPKGEARGAVFRYANGTAGDPVRILQEGGANYVRLKVWVNSPDGYHGKPQILAMARRAQALGMRTLIDFHYSDSWADPGQQTKPAAWQNLSSGALEQAVYNHTYDILDGLRAQGTPAAMAQIGNEINGGMLWPDGRYTNWPQLGRLLTAGVRAARAASPGIQIALHLAEGGNNAGTVWWFDNALAQGVSFDVIALSFYGYWHGTLDDLQFNLNDVSARYGKDVLVAETAYPFRTDSKDSHPQIITAREPVAGLPAIPEGQLQWMRSITTVVSRVPNNRGLGVFYWEPAWTAVPGNGWDPYDPNSGNAWENQALFDYDNRALPAATWR